MAIRTVRRLVELTDGGCSTEIDQIKLKRVAYEFRDWLLSIDPNDDPYGIVRKNLPLVESVIDGTLRFPYCCDRPLDRELWEGMIREDYRKASSTFYFVLAGLNTIPDRDKDGYVTGMTIIEKDGKRYAWAEFELPEDDAA